MTDDVLRKINWVLSQQLGIDLRRLAKSPIGIARYVRDLQTFRKGAANSTIRMHPCLHDWWEQAGAIGNEYFWQDLFVARMIHRAAPERHVDVGSRLDGFVAHVASFREVEVFDVRPLTDAIPGVTFRRADLMKAADVPSAYADSVSCLHAIEHFGLGRYGDPIEPDGVRLGLLSLAKLLTIGGSLYLSCPLGDDVVHFNAHRSLMPRTIAHLASGAGLRASLVWAFNHATKVFEPIPLDDLDSWPREDPSLRTLALYVFERVADAPREARAA